MNITWKDGVTTLATAGAVALERAYFHKWDVPLVSSTRWVLAGIGLMLLVGMVSSYVFDHAKSVAWSTTAGALALTALALGGLGVYYETSDFVVLLMLNAVVFWLASLVRHVTFHQPLTHSTA